VLNQLSTARLLPPPYSALMMLRIAENRALTPPQRAEIARDAYGIATDGQVRALPAMASTQEGSAAAWLARWDLSALDPKSIALQAYLLFRENAFKDQLNDLNYPNRIASRTAACRDLYVEDPYDYFDVAARAGEATYRRSWGSIRSAVEVGRAMGALFEMPRDERRRMATFIVAKLQDVPLSDREFAYAMSRTPLHNAVLKVAEEVDRRRTLQIYRTFLLRHMRDRRCSDNPSNYKGVILEFNQLAETANVSLLELEDGVGVNADPDTRFEPSLSSGPAFALRDKIGKLVMDETHVTSVLREVDEYLPSSQLSTEEAITAKSYLYAAAFDKVKGTRWAERALRQWVRYVAYGPAKQHTPALWFACARTVADWAYNNPVRLSEVEASGDPALAAMVRLDPPRQRTAAVQ
jgi:hypothetical protein